ncbi:MAG: hypothetical protein AAGA85_15430 [Bacteroidota bacterium]
MDADKKKALILLKSLIFHYHGLDHDEKKLLDESVEKLGAQEELDWALDFISRDYLSAFERCREFLSKTFQKLDKKERLEHLVDVWEDNHKKGYVTEMETTAMINLAKDWAIEKEFLNSVQA